MSQSEIVNSACPTCGANAPVEFWASLDRKSLDDVLSGALQHHVCAECSAKLHFPPALTYFDPEAGLWVSARPPDEMSDWETAETSARASFEACYGPTAPSIAQDIGKTLRARLTFGWSALQEKLLLSVFDLDDVTMELLKLAVLRDRPGNPLSSDAELRVRDIRGRAIELAWMDRDTGDHMEVFETPLALYETLQDSDSWAAPRTMLEAGLLVDINRILLLPR